MTARIDDATATAAGFGAGEVVFGQDEPEWGVCTATHIPTGTTAVSLLSQPKFARDESARLLAAKVAAL